MRYDIESIQLDFSAAADRYEVEGWPCSLETYHLPAPHRPPKLKTGFAAVYGFALSERINSTAGPGTVLKVGRVSQNSEPRFRYQHYKVNSAGSTLAKSLLTYRVLWPWLGIDSLDETTVKPWMLNNLDRFHILVPEKSPVVLNTLEMYVRARIGSVFEGAA